MRSVREKIPPHSETRQQKEALILAQQELFKNGITSVHEAGAGLKTINFMEELFKKGDLELTEPLKKASKGLLKWENLRIL